MKKCYICKEEKEKTEFHKDKQNKDELSYSCKKCSKERKIKNYW